MDLPSILIVDDKEFDRILYKEYLDDSNYNFNELDDGDLVIDYLKNTIPDILLLDWQMPRLGGLDVLKLIKKNKNFQNIPIIIITGLADERVLEEAFDYGSVDFLNKPVSKIELNARVMNALNLMEAKRALFAQKEELIELNAIIKSQKIELEKSLELKSEQLETNEKEFEKGINEKSKKVITMEMDSNRLSNNLKTVISQVKEATTKLKAENSDSSVIKSLKSIERTLEGLTSHDSNWDDFKLAFEQIDADFFNNLSKVNPRLTSLDLKHCAYIKMNLDNYEVSRILNVEMKSLQMTRYRLKKKLKLDEKTLLREYIHSI